MRLLRFLLLSTITFCAYQNIGCNNSNQERISFKDTIKNGQDILSKEVYDTILNYIYLDRVSNGAEFYKIYVKSNYNLTSIVLHGAAEIDSQEISDADDILLIDTSVFFLYNGMNDLKFNSGHLLIYDKKYSNMFEYDGKVRHFNGLLLHVKNGRVIYSKQIDPSEYNFINETNKIKFEGPRNK